MDKTYLTIKQVAEITGYAKGTIYNFVNRKEIPFYKDSRSRSIRFAKGEILGWMENRFKRVATLDEKVFDLMGSIQR